MHSSSKTPRTFFRKESGRSHSPFVLQSRRNFDDSCSSDVSRGGILQSPAQDLNVKDEQRGSTPLSPFHNSRGSHIPFVLRSPRDFQDSCSSEVPRGGIVQSPARDSSLKDEQRGSVTLSPFRNPISMQNPSSISEFDIFESFKDEKKQKNASHIKTAMKDFIGTFGSCFRQPKTIENSENDFFTQDISVTSVASENSIYHSTASYASSVSSSYEDVENTVGIVIFTMSDLKKATVNFSPKLKIGQGGFGTIYKGKLRDGRIVAVKRGKRFAHDNQLSAEFQNEVATLSNVDHLNLVKLVGYFEDPEERILVFEYVPNGNLRQHLDGAYGTTLDLPTRLDISIDIAHALTYLHSYADRSFIHRDVKSSNILLTNKFRAKVADFGFARTGPWDAENTHVSTQIKGTAGYLDPEYLKSYQLTQKSDVYSFGILLVEIITGRRPIEKDKPSHEKITLKWAFQLFVEGRTIQLLDPNLRRETTSNFLVERMLELAFKCAAPTRHERPTMKKVAEILWNIRKDYHGMVQISSPASHHSSARSDLSQDMDSSYLT